MTEEEIKSLIEKNLLDESDKLIEQHHRDKMIEFANNLEEYLSNLKPSLQYRLCYQFNKVIEFKLNNTIQIIYEIKENFVSVKNSKKIDLQN